MNFDEVMLNRRSVRKYVSPANKEDIEEIIKFARLAPSWKNSQTARFYAIVSDDKKETFRKTCLPEGNSQKAENADIIVTTFVKNRSGFSKNGESECGQGWGYFDLGCAVENLCLKAREMGYGTLIIGLRDGAKIRELLSVPHEEEIAAVIAIGRTDLFPEAPPHKPTEEILKFI